MDFCHIYVYNYYITSNRGGFGIMKKLTVVLLAVFFISISSAFASENSAKTERDGFYSVLQAKLGISRIECAKIRTAGFSPYFSFVLLMLAKETGRPVSSLIDMRLKDGLSWKDMCETLGINYDTFMDSVDKAVIDNNITFPVAVSEEQKNTVTTVKRNKGGLK
jgi:hypothetical protein